AETSVTWSANLGSIDATGLYRAPKSLGTDYVFARSNASGATVLVQVTILQRPPRLVGISGPASPGETITLTGDHLYGSFVAFPSFAGPIHVQASVSSDTAATVTV